MPRAGESIEEWTIERTKEITHETMINSNESFDMSSEDKLIDYKNKQKRKSTKKK